MSKFLASEFILFVSYRISEMKMIALQGHSVCFHELFSNTHLELL